MLEHVKKPTKKDVLKNVIKTEMIVAINASKFVTLAINVNSILAKLKY